MNIVPGKPCSIFAQGKRDNMEDFIFPEHGTAEESDRFFIVCDGMGGHNKGETASRLAARGFAGYFAQHSSGNISEQYFKDAFLHVEQLFDNYLDEHKEAHGMGTTLVMIYFMHDTAFVTHCGDSRCYHFRGAELLWRTSDHVLAEEWVRQGRITAEEAGKYAKSNVITRAIQGYKTLKVEPDIGKINDIKPGDYFLLCSDGIYESLTDLQLCEIFASNTSAGEKIQIIEELCEGNSRDNYSAYLLNIIDAD
jgi:protein phosphatase